MKHKALLTVTSLGLAGVVFVIAWLLGGLLWGNVAAGMVFVSSMLIVGITYKRSTKVISEQQQRLALQGEQVLYADIASFMQAHKEYTGALLITPCRLVFCTPPRRKNNYAMDIPLADIALAQEVHGYFRLAAGGKDMRFKVFGCEKLVQVIHDGINTLQQQQHVLRVEMPLPE